MAKYKVNIDLVIEAESEAEVDTIVNNFSSHAQVDSVSIEYGPSEIIGPVDDDDDDED